MQRLPAVVASVAGIALAAYYVRRIRSLRARVAVRSCLAQIMTDRFVLPKGTLASESDHARLRTPAVVGRTRRILLGDLGTVEMLLENHGASVDGHQVSAVLVCMGADAAAAVSREFDKKRLAYEGLGNCVDKEGYPLLANHLLPTIAFVSKQLKAAEPSGACVLIHCHEGKNRSAALCVRATFACCHLVAASMPRLIAVRLIAVGRWHI